MKKSKTTIQLHDHYEHLSITRIYDIEDQLCTARVTIYAFVSERNDVDITDNEVTFYLNGKSCNFKGFKELYISLFSAEEFANYYQELVVQAENAVHATYAALKNIERL